MTPVWDSFLTERDKQHIAAIGDRGRFGFGSRPALLSIDNYRWAVGDEPKTLLESIKEWPGSTGLEAWTALAHIENLFAVARAANIPLVHLTGLDPLDSGVNPWSSGRKRVGDQDPALRDRQARRYDIVPQAAPVPGEAVLHKTGPSAFFGTPLLAHLNALQVDTLIICGESTSGCVRASVVDARAYRYRVIVVEDCVYDRHQASHAINLFDMHMKYADVLPLSEVLDWMKSYQPSS